MPPLCYLLYLFVSCTRIFPRCEKLVTSCLRRRSGSNPGDPAAKIRGPLPRDSSGDTANIRCYRKLLRINSGWNIPPAIMGAMSDDIQGLLGHLAVRKRGPLAGN